MGPKIPPIFVGQRTPELAVAAEHGEALAEWSRAWPRPRAVLALGPDFVAPRPTRGSTRPSPARFGSGAGAIPYAPPGAPELAHELASLIRVDEPPRKAGERRALAPLVHMYPDADVPVLELSLVEGATPRRLFALGQALGPLASRGVLVLGVGAITHHRATRSPHPSAEPHEAVRAFDAWFANVLADAEVDELLAWRTMAPSPREALDTPTLLDPLFVVAGAASLYEHAVGFPIRGFDHATISRRCVQFGR